MRKSLLEVHLKSHVQEKHAGVVVGRAEGFGLTLQPRASGLVHETSPTWQLFPSQFLVYPMKGITGGTN